MATVVPVVKHDPAAVTPSVRVATAQSPFSRPRVRLDCQYTQQIETVRTLNTYVLIYMTDPE